MKELYEFFYLKGLTKKGWNEIQKMRSGWYPAGNVTTPLLSNFSGQPKHVLEVVIKNYTSQDLIDAYRLMPTDFSKKTYLKNFPLFTSDNV